MGIDLEIKATIERSWGHRSFVDARTAIEKLGRGYVTIEDVLTRLFFQRGPRFDYTFTTMEFYKAFVEPIRTAFVEYGARVYVAIVDEVAKPKRKARTHAKRAAASRRPRSVRVFHEQLFGSYCRFFRLL